jgi:RNA polymerase sigma factor (sigma-70 family)
MSITINHRPDSGDIGDDRVGRLVPRAASGDESNWRRLVESFDGMLHSIARSHRLGDADAADVVQTAWLKLVEHLDDLREPERVGPWLATTTRRECLRVLARAARQTTFGDDWPERESTHPRPGDDVLTAERNRGLSRCLARLRASDQALLRMLLADPCPAYEDIGATLGMPIGSIGPTRARALERLRRELDSDGMLDLLVA